MSYNVVLSNSARKNLKKIKGKDNKRLAVALKGLEDNPYVGRKMKGKNRNYYRLRVWPYRIVYEIKNKRLIVFVIVIGQREGIYN